MGDVDVARATEQHIFDCKLNDTVHWSLQYCPEDRQNRSRRTGVKDAFEAIGAKRYRVDRLALDGP